MPPAFVQTAFSPGNSVAFGSNNTAGDLLFVVSGEETSAGVPTITDTNGNTGWVKLPTQSEGSHQCTVFYLLNCKAGANTINVSYAGGASGFGQTATAEYSGVDTLEQTAQAVTDPTTSPLVLTLMHAPMLVLGGFDEGFSVWTPGTGFTLRTPDGSSSSVRIALEDIFPGATGPQNVGLAFPGGTIASNALAFYKTGPAPAFVQAANGFTPSLRASNPLTVPFLIPVLAGHTVVVFTDTASVSGDVVSGVKFNGTAMTKVAGPSSAHTHNINAWVLDNVTPSGGTDSVEVDTVSIQNNVCGTIILEYSEAASPSFDQTASGNGIGSTAVSIGPSGATSIATEVVIAFASTLQLEATNAFTAGAGYTARNQFSEDSQVGYQMFAQDKNVSSIGTQTATATLDNPVGWAGLLITLKVTPSLIPHSISGTCEVNSADISYSGTASGSVTADSLGNYTIPGLLDGPYTITPDPAFGPFTPTSRNVTLAGADVTGVNFAVVHGISGNVGVGGATVTLSGAGSGTTTADIGGNYTFLGLADGSGYVVTPSLAGYTFSPTSRNVTIAGSDVLGVNFTATPVGPGGSGTFDFRFRF